MSKEGKYIEVASISRAADRVCSTISDLHDSNPELYSMSLERLAIVRQKFYQSIAEIDDMLGDHFSGEMDLPCISATKQTSTSDLEARISAIEAKLDMSISTEGEDEFVSTPAFIDKPEIRANDDSFKVTETSKDININDRKSAIASYSRVFEDMSNTDVPYTHVSECAKLLNKWLKGRFHDTPEGFYYNIRNLPHWTKCIVAAYSKHVCSGDVQSFINDFDSWCESVNSNSNNYVIPYSVFQLSKKPTSEDATLTAAVLWDMLSDIGLNKLYHRKPPTLYPNASDMYDWLKKINIDVLDNYIPYKSDPNVLLLAHIERIEGGDNKC